MTDEPETIYIGADLPDGLPFMPKRFREGFAKALRLAALFDGAPQRCRRKACRRANRCHLTIGDKGEGDCPGGMSMKAIDNAVMMLWFITTLANPEETRT